MEANQIITEAVRLARAKDSEGLRVFYGQHRDKFSEAEWNFIKFRVAANKKA